MCLAQVVKKFEFGSPALGGPPILVHTSFEKLYLFFIFTYLENFMYLAWKVKKFKF